MDYERKSTFKYALCRIAEMILILLILSMIVFALSRLCPGDPLRSWYGDGVDRMSAEQKASARESLGFEKPLPVQYGIWLKDLAHGELGLSYKYKRPVAEVIRGVLANTIVFGLTAYIMTFVLAFRLGRLSAKREGTKLDRFICKAGVISGNIPVFFLSLICILIFAVNLRILPTGGLTLTGLKEIFWTEPGTSYCQYL